jgi:hypothetical protein
MVFVVDSITYENTGERKKMFHEGQQAEVHCFMPMSSGRGVWRKAKIVERGPEVMSDWYRVQFPDGTRAVFDAEHIRTVEPQHTATYSSNPGTLDVPL